MNIQDLSGQVMMQAHKSGIHYLVEKMPNGWLQEYIVSGNHLIPKGKPYNPTPKTIRQKALDSIYSILSN
ncbi:MAG: hypothetical protein LPD71_00035 [Shewanella sp.]|nr:hypothetical protein [Shewanella sp.]MCF1437190.1 hypothetical protein [Shewanella sp.]MCF1459496.1 hypothetical protein [Shewanella sp.]